MAAGEFADLVAAVADAMGQRADAVRSSPDGLLLHTTDGFLFAFLEDPTKVSLANIQRLLKEPDARAGRLVVLTPGRLPLALAAEAGSGRASLVEHDRFRELLRGLDLGERLGESPRGPHDRPGSRLLPSARHLDAVTARARVWLEWGVPALALRFYHQALRQKPEFLPAQLGVAKSLQALGLAEEALAAYQGILERHPGDIDARLGEATLHASAGRTEQERRIYQEILASHPDRLDVRVQLIAAEIEEGRWVEARREIEALLQKTPEDARIRYLHSAALEHTGHPSEGRREVERARALGLSFDQEASLALQLGLPAPPQRPPVEELPPKVAEARDRKVRGPPAAARQRARAVKSPKARSSRAALRKGKYPLAGWSAGAMRIVSVLPSATEIVYRLGAGSELVGRSEECDFPPEVRGLPVVMRAKRLDGDRPSAEIDARVRASLSAGESLYELDRTALAALRPDLILTQDLCRVCSVTDEEVAASCRSAGIDPRIVSLTPTTLEGVWSSIERIGEAVRREGAALSLAAELRKRTAPSRAHGGPRVAVIEWIDPPFESGLWTPELILSAGGTPWSTVPGGAARRLSWEQLLEDPPDLLVLSPCSFSVDRTRRELGDVSLGPRLRDLALNYGVWIADEAYFSRPGPRLADGRELIHRLLHPGTSPGQEGIERWSSRAPGITA